MPHLALFSVCKDYQWAFQYMSAYRYTLLHIVKLTGGVTRGKFIQKSGKGLPPTLSCRARQPASNSLVLHPNPATACRLEINIITIIAPNFCCSKIL